MVTRSLRTSHGAQMEGHVWRVTDVASSRVVAVLCAVWTVTPMTTGQRPRSPLNRTTRTSGTSIRHVGVDVVGADIEIRRNFAFDGRRASLLFGQQQVILGLRSHGTRLGLLSRGGDLTGLGLITMFLSLVAQLYGLLIRSAHHQDGSDCHDNGNDDDNQKYPHAAPIPDPTWL